MQQVVEGQHEGLDDATSEDAASEGDAEEVGNNDSSETCVTRCCRYNGVDIYYTVPQRVDHMAECEYNRLCNLARNKAVQGHITGPELNACK
jgi:hypothetical protein